MSLKDPLPKWSRSGLLIWRDSSRAHVPPHVPQLAPQQAPPPATFNDNFRSNEERTRYERLFAKCKIKDICTIKMEDFIEAKFQYLVTSERFGWMPYLTT